MKTVQNESRIITSAVLEMLMKRRKLDDHLVLPDHLLEAAADGWASLSPAQYDALLDSPLTLRRFAVLQANRAQSQHAPAANDDEFWQGSMILRRAADGGTDGRVDHFSDNGHWQLSFQRMGNTGWLVSLTLRDPQAAPPALAAGGQAVELVDGRGEVWFGGCLDPEADQGPSLEIAWDGDETPEQRFIDRGARFTVRPC